jgi:hypothetical protein
MSLFVKERACQQILGRETFASLQLLLLYDQHYNIIKYYFTTQSWRSNNKFCDE